MYLTFVHTKIVFRRVYRPINRINVHDDAFDYHLIFLVLNRYLIEHQEKHFLCLSLQFR